MNICVFEGNLASEPMYFEGENSRVVFTLAIDRDEKPVDGKRTADFFEFVAWRNKADYIHRFCHKGDVLCVACEARNWETPVDDGKANRKTEFHVERVYLTRRARANMTEKTD